MFKTKHYVILFQAVLLVGGSISTAQAFVSATQGFTLTAEGCSGDCGTAPWGTVTVSQDASNSSAIDIGLALNNPYRIHATANANHPAFAFNLAGSPAVTLSLPSGFSWSSSAHAVAPFGSFGYSVSCDAACANGYNANNPQFLSLVVTPSTGVLTLSSIVANASGYYFSTDVANTNGQTGNIASNAVSGPTGSVPEPGIVALMAIGSLGLALGRRQIR